MTIDLASVIPFVVVSYANSLLSQYSYGNKVATLNDVARKASEILAQNGKATTLEIKMALRNDGYFARQEAVAYAMYTLWGVYEWHWTFNGTYRTYYPSFYDALNAFGDDSVGIEQTSWLGWLSSGPAGQPAASNSAPTASNSTPVETNSPSDGDWYAFHYAGTKPPMFISGIDEGDWTKSRNVARHYYAVETGLSYPDIGANVVRLAS